jgi:hypothetical protein
MAACSTAEATQPPRRSPCRSFAVDDRATAEQVFASERFGDLTQVLAAWVGERLPDLEGNELLSDVGDRLLLDAVHPSGTPVTR